MLSKKIARSLVIASLAVFLSAPALADPGAPPAAPMSTNMPARQVSAPTAAPMTTAPTSSAEGQRYASREGNAKALETFVGGEQGVYIGSGAVVVALLIVLIIILI